MIDLLAELAAPKVLPKLDPGFRPAALANRAYRALPRATAPLVFGLERPDGTLSRYETVCAPEDQRTLPYAERLLKFLLWQKGGCRAWIGGPREIGEALAAIYAPTGARAFDHEFMGQTVNERPFEVRPCAPEEVPPAHETSRPIGRNLDGCRLGFDLGASDYKVAAAEEGEERFAHEYPWSPRDQTDPQYHFDKVMGGLREAARHLPRVDAIGGSSAGVIVNNRPMVASLFRGVPKELFEARVKGLFLEIGAAWGVPIEVANDGDVTALAGAMTLGDAPVLGIAMGSSEAAGYVDAHGHIMGWLNELAFAPIDYRPGAPEDEWSRDHGCGVQYLTQQAVFRLAKANGIAIDESLDLADRLKSVQRLLQAGDPVAVAIWETIGTYCGYAIAHYADFYDLRQVLILGRVTSGDGGPLVIEGANRVLAEEFPELAARVRVNLPDERFRRLGQSVAAASLPKVS
jgi:predicted NBD/HSP70 family sugar kinase